MEQIGQYLLSVTAVCFLLSLVQSVLPNGVGKRTVTMTGGLLLILAVLSPAAKPDAMSFAQILSRTRMEMEEMRTGIAVENRALLAAIIKEKTEAYVCDKAVGLGVEVTVQVTLQDEAGYPYPCHVVLAGRIAPAEQQQLSRMITEDLGIPPEEQEWRWKE